MIHQQHIHFFQFDMDYSDSYLAEEKIAGNLKRKKNRSSKLVKRVKDMDKIEEVLKQFEDLKNNQDDESNNLSEPAETPPGKQIIIILIY